MVQSLKRPISVEFFPPKTPEGVDKLRVTRRALYALSPEFCSVTYGAGGSTREGTLAQVREILADGVSAAPHLSCIGATRAGMSELLAEFRAANIRRIVALRGDLPSGYGAMGEFHHASDLVSFIRQETGDTFQIVVAAYPEMHPQSRDFEADVDAFVAKVEAGANAAITQYFFNADAYFRFVDEVARRGVAIPVVPGIMPVTNSSQLLRFSDACGAEVPRWMRLRLVGYGDDRESIRAFGLDAVSGLAERLLAGGAPSLHFYTMNQSQPVLDIAERLAG